MNNRTLLISPSFPPPLIGGHKVWTYNLATNSGVSIDVLTSSLKQKCSEIQHPKNMNIIRRDKIYSSKSEDIDPSNWTLFKSYLYVAYWLVNYVVFRRKYSLVIVHGFVVLNAIVILLLKLTRVKVVGMGNSEEYTLCIYGKGLKNSLKKILLKVHIMADGYVLVCHFAKRILNELGMDNDKIFVIPSSVNLEKNQITGDIVTNKNSILSVGRLIERKGFHFLVSAISIVKEEFNDVSLTIIGNGPYLENIQQEITKNHLENNVKILSGLSDKELAILYNSSSLFVLAHTMLANGDTEGCPTVFSEAYAARLPVIGGTGAGADTIIIEGQSGFIIDTKNIELLANKIKMLLSDKDLSRKFGEFGYNKVLREHTPKATGIKFGSMINSFLNHP